MKFYMENFKVKKLSNWEVRLQLKHSKKYSEYIYMGRKKKPNIHTHPCIRIYENDDGI